VNREHWAMARHLAKAWPYSTGPIYRLVTLLDGDERAVNGALVTAARYALDLDMVTDSLQTLMRRRAALAESSANRPMEGTK
jgi:hypothetical protein